MLHIYDEGHVLFSTLAVVSGITQPSHDTKNYVFIRGRGFNEPCSMCFVISLCSFNPSISLRWCFMTSFTHIDHMCKFRTRIHHHLFSYWFLLNAEYFVTKNYWLPLACKYEHVQIKLDILASAYFIIHPLQYY